MEPQDVRAEIEEGAPRRRRRALAAGSVAINEFDAPAGEANCRGYRRGGVKPFGVGAVRTERDRTRYLAGRIISQQLGDPRLHVPLGRVRPHGPATPALPSLRCD